MLEAMSAGCIVVASNIPNINEIITDSKNGFLHNFNEEEIKHKIEKINNNYEDYKDVIEKSRNTIKNNFDLQNIANLELKIYKQLTDN